MGSPQAVSPRGSLRSASTRISCQASSSDWRLALRVPVSARPLRAGSALLGPAIVLAGAAVGCRIALVKRVEGAFGLGTHPYWLLPLRDLLSFAVFVAGLLGRDVDWRGRRYQVVSGGTLIAEGRSP